jgi:hypothetical protein
VIDEVPEDVSLVRAYIRIDFDGGDDLQPRRPAGLQGLGDAVGGVVVREGQNADSPLPRRPDEAGRREDAVGRGAMGVKIDAQT